MISSSPDVIQTLLNDPAVIFRIGFLLFSVIYFIFTLVVIRQVNLMTRTIITEGGPILRFLSYLYALLGLGAIVYFIFFL